VIQIAVSHDMGYRSYLGNAGFTWSHGCASDLHTSNRRLNQFGSCRLAVLIATMSGLESVLTKIGEPHSGQKPRFVLPPLALGDAWKRGVPCKSLKASAVTMTKDENGPPLVVGNLGNNSETSPSVRLWIRSESPRTRICQ
jgi:hypothetical protein